MKPITLSQNVVSLSDFKNKASKMINNGVKSTLDSY